MCWRGHAASFHYVSKQGSSYCRLCHAMRVKSYRSGYPARTRPLFALDRERYERMKLRYGWRDKTVALLAGISVDAIADYKRGVHGGARKHRATREFAARIARAMSCDFSQLWSEV